MEAPRWQTRILVDRVIYRRLRYVASRHAVPGRGMPESAGLNDQRGEGLPMRLDRGMDAIAGSLITAFDYVWGRLTGRLSGLTDEEYFWEPVAGC